MIACSNHGDTVVALRRYTDGTASNLGYLLANPILMVCSALELLIAALSGWYYLMSYFPIDGKFFLYAVF